MAGVSGRSGMSGMSGCSGSQHSKMAGTPGASEQGTSVTKIEQPVSLDANLGGKVDIAV